MQHGTKIWMRLRRYTDFCKLHAELSKTLHEMPLLPPKLIFNNDEDIADRFLALDTYLCQLLSNDVIRRHTKLQAFLGLEQRCGALCDRQNECATHRPELPALQCSYRPWVSGTALMPHARACSLAAVSSPVTCASAPSRLPRHAHALPTRVNRCDPLLSQSEGNRFIRDVDL
jgi:hypothetical protein